jgi:hypothetical protein
MLKLEKSSIFKNFEKIDRKTINQTKNIKAKENQKRSRKPGKKKLKKTNLSRPPPSAVAPAMGGE